MNNESLLHKLCSIKFLVSLASGLGCFGMAIAGFATANTLLATVGLVCTAASAGIFSFSRSWTEGKAIMANADTVQTVKQVSATTTTAKTIEKIVSGNTEAENGSKA